jgi:hypothetical protein
MRIIVFPILSLFIASVIAAPVPKEVKQDEEVIRLFGKPQNPQKQAEFAIRGKSLSIHLTKKIPRNEQGLKFPHTLREARGNFELEVTMRYTLPEKVPPLGGGAHAVGGIFIWESDENHVLFQRYHQPCGRFDGTTAWDMNFRLEFNRPKLPQHHQHGVGKRESPPIRLRLTRDNGTLSTAYRTEGEDWKTLDSGEMKFPETVHVGVYALRETDAPATVEFENFTVTPIPKKDPANK